MDPDAYDVLAFIDHSEGNLAAIAVAVVSQPHEGENVGWD